MQTRITVENIKRFSEDYLNARLDFLADCGLEFSPEFRLIDAHLDSLSEQMVAEEANRLAKEQADREAFARQLEELNNKRGKRVVMSAMVAEFGSEFYGNYSILTEDDIWVVKSSCTNPRNSQLKDTWSFNSHVDATQKIETLVYYRVYDNYFREPDLNNIRRLKAAILDMLGE